MTPSKKQITEVTKIAAEMNINIEKALSTLKSCSASIYKTIGAKGVVEASKESAEIGEAANDGGILFHRCEVIGNTEKAYLIILPLEAGNAEKWIPKSCIKVINGNTIIPFWAIK